MFCDVVGHFGCTLVAVIFCTLVKGYELEYNVLVFYVGKSLK